MKKKVGASLVLSILLTACGGGGDPGTSPYGAGSGSGTSSTTSGSTSTSSNSSGSLVVSLSARTISSSAPGVVTALVKDASGAVVPNVVVTFAVTNGALATLGSTSGLTNSSGEASTTISPTPAVATGAANVTASVTLPGTSTALTAEYAFSVASTNVTLDDVTPGDDELEAYESTSLAVGVSEATSLAPVTLTASSTCASQGKATISPATLTLTSTTGSFTYQDNGCGSEDQVTVQIQGTSQTRTATLTVEASAATALTFVSASPPSMCLMSSGCAGTSTVRFRLVDSGGQGIDGETVNFTLDQPGAASLGVPSGVTDSDGYVSVVVSAGIVPTPVRVAATLASALDIKTVSNALTVLSGLPYQSGLTFAAESYTVNANLIGDSTSLTVRLIDRFGNPVENGTSVSFMTEGGSVTPGTCSTAAGECSVNFVVQNPRPANGRVTVVAYAQGEEDFDDVDNSNTYNSAVDTFTADLGPVHVDSDEDGAVDAGERVVGVAANGTWDSNAYVRGSIYMVLSNTLAAPRLFTVSGGNCTTTPFSGTTVSLAATCSQNLQICVRDGNSTPGASNPIIAGSTLSMAIDVSDATVTIDNTPVNEANAAPTIHTVTISRKVCGTALAADGQAKLTINVMGKSWLYEAAAPIFVTK